jgi:hypothetical protein
LKLQYLRQSNNEEVLCYNEIDGREYSIVMYNYYIRLYQPSTCQKTQQFEIGEQEV